MRVLIVSNMYPDTDHPSYGIFVKRFTDQLEELNIHYDLSVMRKKNGKLKKVINYFLFFIISFFKCLFYSYDIVYIHYASHSSIPVLWASNFKKFRVYTNVHGSDVVPINKNQEKFQKYTEKILKKSEKIIVPSEYFENLVSEKYNIPKDEIFIYPSGGIDINIFKPFSAEKINELKIKYKINNEYSTFCFASRMIASKGWETLIKAINVVYQKGLKFNILMVGSGPDDIECNQLIKEYNLEKIVKRFPLLPQNELAEIYNVSDAFIFPTRGESLGLVGIEAMACGVPVIASNNTAPKYYIKDGVNGFKFPFGDYKKLADILERFIRNKNIDTSYKNNCLTISKKYGENYAIEQLRKIFI